MDKKIKGMMMVLMLISLLFAVWGVAMHMKVTSEEAKFHALQDAYLSQAKSVRDGAASITALCWSGVKASNCSRKNTARC